MTPQEIYRELLGHFGPQGWWPVGNGFDPPGFEVCVGAILTQNTNWKNVEKALENLRAVGMTTPGMIAENGIEAIENAVRPSGFYRQKAERLRAFSGFVEGCGGFARFSKNVTREQLLGVRGLGPETADSILLYALGRPVFVIDAYTRRVFTRLGFPDKGGYEEWRAFFEENLPRDVGVYREFHALIVRLAKESCRSKPICSICFLRDGCKKRL
jgi:endonuclease-3 related protein